MILNNIEFVNYSVIDYELLNKIIYDVRKSYKEPIIPCVVILLPPTQLEVISLGHIYSLSMIGNERDVTYKNSRDMIKQNEKKVVKTENDRNVIER